jgi:hypothetical protein
MFLCQLMRKLYPGDLLLGGFDNLVTLENSCSNGYSIDFAIMQS